MIQEIINFTDNLIADIPDVMQWKIQPSKGLHIFVDIDNDGKWTNQNFEKGNNYDYYDGKNKDIPMWKDCVLYQGLSDYITMNKVKKFDSKQKIHSCSPFSIAFNFNFNDADKKERNIKSKPTKEEKEETEQKIREERIKVIKDRLQDYQKCSCAIYFSQNENKIEQEKENLLKNMSCSFLNLVSSDVLNEINNIPEFSTLTGKDYVRIYLRSVSVDVQRHYYQKYLKQEILNGEEINHNNVGAIGFMSALPDKKIFMRHKTSLSIKGVNHRYSKEEALIINDFEKLLRRNVLPNPLPIVIDKREINTQIVKIFHENETAISYRELIARVFERNNMTNLPDYYLLFYTKTMSGLVFNDFDFVPLFRFEIDAIICNGTELKSNDSVMPNKRIRNIFELEQVFNSLFLRYDKNNKNGYGFLIGNYFGEKVESQKTFKNYSIRKETLSAFYQYRKSIYDYIYKSKKQSLTADMFDKMVYSAIIADIQMDEYINERHTKFFPIREKINIWFSLYNLFNNNKKTEIMASKVTDLMSRMRNVVKGESILETPEEFAFCAGQVVSYLIDRSAASDKTYALLEPYLQKTKSNLLQDAIAQTISVYKHDISTYKGAFQSLASNVLTYDENIDMKPLLKYFLAGCFCQCIIYEKKDNNNNN